MARDMSDAEIMKMELEQLQKEVKNTREPVSISRAVVPNIIVHFFLYFDHVYNADKSIIFSLRFPPDNKHRKSN